MIYNTMGQESKNWTAKEQNHRNIFGYELDRNDTNLCLNWTLTVNVNCGTKVGWQKLFFSITRELFAIGIKNSTIKMCSTEKKYSSNPEQTSKSSHKKILVNIKYSVLLSAA